MWKWEAKLDNLNMNKERDLTKDKAKADRYARWFEEDGLKDALLSIKQSYINGIINSHVTDVQGRENCYIAIGVVERLEGHIRSVIGGGKIAEKQLEKIRREQTKDKVFKLF